MTFKVWLILFVVAMVLYSGVVLVFPKIMDAQMQGGTPEPNPVPVEQSAKAADAAKAKLAPKSTSVFKKEPLGETPFFIEENVVSASLQALEKHGADLSKPMPSTHRMRCESALAIDAISDWAQKAGFEVKAPETVHLHGGVEKFMIDLVKTEVPDISSIQAQGQLVASAAAKVDGVTYATWVGAVVR